MRVLKKRWMGLVFLGVAVLWAGWAAAADRGQFSTEPKTDQGRKWRLGYYEGGEYADYQKNLISTVRGLMELGWIQTVDIPVQKEKQTRELWAWLSDNASSAYLEFAGDGHYCADWDKEKRREVAAGLVERLKSKKDLDLMIAMGTWAGQDLAVPDHRTPVIVQSTSDPISAGIIKSVEDSGFDHVMARVDAFRYERQIRVFHDIIGFDKLGVAYKNDETGKSYAAIDRIEKVAREKGFELVSCHLTPDLAIEQEEAEVRKCFEELSGKAGAVYVAATKGINKKTIPELVRIMNAHKIPTFSQSGSEEVKQGILLSIAVADYKYVGQFYARSIAKIFNGAKPGQLDQVFEDPPKIAINLKTAELIGYDPPVDVLGTADEIYQDIVQPE